jgi:hypothetical protein
MKPSWDDAPKWAQYLAMDDDGDWYWFENEPKFKGCGWSAPGRSLYAGKHIDAKDTMEPRPE